MDKLISDSAKNEISHKVKDILRAYNINDWQSEPYHQNQNPAEWRYGAIKAWANTIMNRTGAPAHYWLLTLQYVCYILNHMSTASLGGQVAPSGSVWCYPRYQYHATLHLLLMISIFHLKVKREQASGLVLQSIVVIPSPTWS